MTKVLKAKAKKSGHQDEIIRGLVQEITFSRGDLPFMKGTRLCHERSHKR
jgi:hypothetical protein